MEATVTGFVSSDVWPSGVSIVFLVFDEDYSWILTNLSRHVVHGFMSARW